MIVVDTSVVIAIILGEAREAAGLQCLRGMEHLHAPALLPYEVASVISAAVNKRGLSPVKALTAITQFKQMPWSFELQSDSTRLSVMLALAQTHRLSAYDAAYLELAIHRGLALATFDADLRKACVRVGVQAVPSK